MILWLFRGMSSYRNTEGKIVIMSTIYFELAQRIKKFIHINEINYIEVNQSAVESFICEIMIIFHRRSLRAHLERNYISMLNYGPCAALEVQLGLQQSVFLKSSV